MISTPIELIALILITISLIKIVTIAIKPMAWFDGVVKPLFGNPKVTQVVSFLLAALVLYYLLIELTIVQVLAVTFFMALLMLGGMVSFAKPFIDDAEKIYRGRHILRKYWLYTLIWVVLLLWGLKEILQ